MLSVNDSHLAKPASGTIALPAAPPLAERIAAAFLVRYSAPTRQQYLKALRSWATWCTVRALDLLAARREHIEQWLRDMETAGLAAATRAQRLAAVSGYYDTAVDEEALPRNPAARVRRPKVGKDSQRLGPDRMEGAALLAAAQRAGARDHALICLLLLNGLRVSEALRLTPTDLEVVRGHRVAHVARKGGRRQVLALPPCTVQALDTLQAERGAMAPDAPLFVDATGAPLDVFDAGRIVRRLTNRAMITSRLSPHSLRHGFVTAGLDAGVPLHQVQDDAGHEDPRTTRRYDRARYSLDGSTAYAVADYFAALEEPT